MPEWQSLFSVLRENDINVSLHDMPRPVGGGDISAAWRIKAEGNSVFLKTGPAESLAMFQAEADGLRELQKADAVRVPNVLGCVSSGTESLLALEWIDFELADSATEKMLGQQLAKQHRYCENRFGWHKDNTIGSTPQHNLWNDDWVEFLAEDRLGFQLELAAKNGFTGDLQVEGAALCKNLGQFFADSWPEASLLHGDLWGGNWAAADGAPVIFDPAVYYGDRESDIAMTKLFGGFGASFYDAYEEAWPLSAGSEQRILLYQLYHVLNHLNLFGGSYLNRALGIIRALS
ncbi:MAG: fructosamine kinase family protein [Gammaproteobacteria bacterium]|nr:MAG: fructosamine kinase family protein [Gammaproteobacteria bacterium]RLA32428.1 MAG: fructosamine kinase family protein [Gammaproteobacteria bacterium]